MQRFIRPEGIAAAVTFLSSPQASAINGAAMHVDDGIVKSVV